MGLSRVSESGALRLPAVTGHAEADTQSCYDCHGDDYTQADGINVHSPGTGSVPQHISPTSSTCFGVGCHDVSKSLPEVHALYAGPGSENPEFATTCALCHANPSIDTKTSGAACTGACHSVTTHSNMTLGHVVTSASSACTGCHESDVNAIHGAYTDLTKCGICHSQPDNWSKSGDCSNCHSMTAPHPNLETDHTATMTNSVMNVFVDHDGGGSVDWDVECSMCHASTQLLTIHDNDCAACHSGAAPAESLGTWNKSCQQGACHPTVEHSQGDSAHTQLASQNCETCHEPNWDVYYSTCEWCHDPAGATAPTTTSDLKANYVGLATINFSAGGVHYTRYKLDGGADDRGQQSDG